MRRSVFSAEHEQFREQVRRYVRNEIESCVPGRNAAGSGDRERWRRFGEAGYLGVGLPLEVGGGGRDFLYAAIVIEELCYVRAHAPQTSLHSAICLPYLVHYGSPAQHETYLRRAIAGELLLASAMTEPGTGSDLAAIRTRARRVGDEYVIDGAKTFIDNGQHCDVVIVVAKTNPQAEPAHRGISLLLVPTDAPGFVRGNKLDELGQRGGGQDTGELFFENCRVPCTNLLGQEGLGFKYLMTQLQQDRLMIAIGSIASCRRTLDDTIAYVKEHHAFGQALASFHNVQSKLAELASALEIGQCFVDRLCVRQARAEELTAEASLAKFWITDLQKRLTSECLHLSGGDGFRLDYPISTDYADTSVQSINAGNNEIMKSFIARRSGLAS